MATKLASTGGFLKTGNTTIFVGTEKEKLEEVLEIIKKECKTNKQNVITKSTCCRYAMMGICPILLR